MKHYLSLSLAALLLVLSACGTPRGTIDAQQASNGSLANQAATAEPGSSPLTMSSSSETIREKMQESASSWRTLFLDGTITWYPPDGGNVPSQVFHEQDWIDYGSHRFRVLLGASGGRADTFRACDGSTILEIDLKTGQSKTSSLPKFAQDPSAPAGQDMLWGQIGTPLAEIGLSANYAVAAGSSGGVYTPVKMDEVAGQPTLVVDWTHTGDSQHAYRAWVDVRRGVILKLQEFGKGGGSTLQGERAVDQIVYDAPLSDALFGAPASPPQFSTIEGRPLAPNVAAPTPSAGGDPMGQVYFFLFDHNYGQETTRLVRLPGSCVAAGNGCPEPVDIPTPVPFKFSLSPLVWSPDGKVAAFAYPGSNNGDLTTLSIFDPSKGTWTALTKFAFIDPPFWSPDGGWLGFRVQDGQGGEDTYAIRRDGSGLVKLSAAAGLFPNHAPYHIVGWIVGNAILRGSDGNAYLVSPDNARATPFLAGLPSGSQLFPSPDGQHLAYVEYSPDSPKRVVKQVNADGTEARDLAAFQAGPVFPVVWSRDGNQLAFVYEIDPTQGDQEIYVVHRDGSGLGQVYHGMGIQTIAFSPDGEYLMIQDHQAAGQHIFLIHLTTFDQHMLQAPGLPLDWWWEAPSWQP